MNVDLYSVQKVNLFLVMSIYNLATNVVSLSYSSINYKFKFQY